MIELIDVSKQYKINQSIIHAVRQVSLQFNDHEIFGIVGESGAGKSTLLRFINLLEKPSQGQVIVNGRDLMALNKIDLRLQRKSISMIFQQFNLLNNKTVGENITLPLSLYSYSDTLNLEEVLEFVGLKEKKDHYPSQLSGGQKQRVGIARALITKPNILLCDEPTSALDLMRTNEIVQLLKKAHQQFDMTIVLVTHELDLVRQLCDRVAIIDQGQLVDLIDNQNVREEDLSESYVNRVREVLT